MDNYANTSSGKLYVDIEGHYPKRLAQPRVTQNKLATTSFQNITPDKTIPKTSTEIDDCPLPTKGGYITEPEEMADLVGTADAYRYTGPLKAAPLIKQGETLLIKTSDPTINPKNFDIEKIILNMSSALFNARYKGSATPR